MDPNKRLVGGARLTSQRLTVQEAAEVLGTSVDAVRMRVRRGTLESEKDPDGRVHVWVNGDSAETRPRLDGEPSALISAKDETIRVLSEQLASEREARRRADTIIAQLTQANAALAARVPELEAPQEEPPEAAEMVEEEPGTIEVPRPDSEGTQEEEQGGVQRPWWRRVFGS
jgi:excisionase family DNA binding protein